MKESLNEQEDESESEEENSDEDNDQVCNVNVNKCIAKIKENGGEKGGGENNNLKIEENVRKNTRRLITVKDKLDFILNQKDDLKKASLSNFKANANLQTESSHTRSEHKEGYNVVGSIWKTDEEIKKVERRRNTRMSVDFGNRIQLNPTNTRRSSVIVTAGFNSTLRRSSLFNQGASRN